MGKSICPVIAVTNQPSIVATIQGQGHVLTDVVGGPHYVAPKVLLKHYGSEADVWKVGVILYIFYSGVPQFRAETQQGIFEHWTLLFFLVSNSFLQ
ncbi:calcium-dependent protein kinase [Trifolium repens]|nr:calcium-dependent protein kinase [Trifolium repens]